MNPLALGTVQFGLPYGIANNAGQVSRAEAKVMLQIASANRIDTIDTAIAYGESEICLGEVGAQSFKLVTKLPALPDNCKNVDSWVHLQVAESLMRLNVKAVYGLLLHCPEQLLCTSGDKLYKALQNLKKIGQVKKIGVSIYAPCELEMLTKLFRFDIVQAPFNLVDRRLYNSGWLQRLKNDDVEIHTRSAFMQGLLLMPQAEIPEKFAPWANLWTRWHNWLKLNELSALQACLAYPLNFPEIDRVIVGADSAKQFEQIISAAKEEIQAPFPNLQCDEENLINPSRWHLL